MMIEETLGKKEDNSINQVILKNLKFLKVSLIYVTSIQYFNSVEVNLIELIIYREYLVYIITIRILTT